MTAGGASLMRRGTLHWKSLVDAELGEGLFVE